MGIAFMDSFPERITLFEDGVYPGTSRFESTRRVKTIEQYDLLELREFLGMNQIYVSKEDYEDVRNFILERVPEKARRRSVK